MKFKLFCSNVTEMALEGNLTQFTVKFYVADEKNRKQSDVVFGSMEFTTQNAELAKNFQPGKYYNHDLDVVPLYLN